MSGWVKLHRKITYNKMWLSEAFTRGQAWVDLVLLAQHKPGAIRRRGILVNLPIGSVGMSQEQLGKRWKWSKGKVRRFLKELELDSMISRKIDQKKTSVSSYIVIENYQEYQKTGPKTDRRRTEDGPKTVPEQEGKEVKEEKNKQTMCEREQIELNIFQQNLFDLIWQEYPKQEDKISAIESFYFLNPNQDQVINKIIPAIKAHRANWNEKRFIPLLGTFLKNKRYDDILDLNGEINQEGEAPLRPGLTEADLDEANRHLERISEQTSANRS